SFPPVLTSALICYFIGQAIKYDGSIENLSRLSGVGTGSLKNAKRLFDHLPSPVSSAFDLEYDNTMYDSDFDDGNDSVNDDMEPLEDVENRSGNSYPPCSSSRSHTGSSRPYSSAQHPISSV